LFDIGSEGIKPGSSIELRSHLMIAGNFGLNFVLAFGKEGCWAIHKLVHQLTALHDIDHSASLSIVAPTFLENQFDVLARIRNISELCAVRSPDWQTK
jgi:alcohol dehydrogenase YqhD (iron-dependent ADH family)